MVPPEKSIRLYTPLHVGVASLLGGPLPACWLVAHNAKEFHQLKQHTMWLISGVISTLLLVVLIMFILPERFPPYVLPVAYTFALRQLAKITQGRAVSRHRLTGGKVGSWWIVVGVGIVGLALLLTVVFLVVLLFPSVET